MAFKIKARVLFVNCTLFESTTAVLLMTGTVLSQRVCDTKAGLQKHIVHTKDSSLSLDIASVLLENRLLKKVPRSSLVRRYF